MTEKTKLIIIGAVVAVLIFIGLLLLTPKSGATQKHNVWETTQTREWSECEPNEDFNECEGGNGTKTRTLSQTCIETEGSGDDECDIKKVWVPAVYDCELIKNIHGTNRDVSEFYNKPTGDDNHCHKIVWGNLTTQQQNAFKAMHGNDEDYSFPNHGSWTSAYNNHIDENPTAHTVTEGYWEYTPETREIEQEQACVIEPNPQVCEAPKDYCDTLEGVQNEEEDCPREEPTPEPGGGNPPTFAGSSTEAPVCPNGTTTNVVANPHVLRNGSEATVNFFITEGDSANIYYSVVGQPHWGNAVSNVKPNSDNFVSYTIRDLDPQLGYDFGIQQTRGNCGGGKVTAVIVDGPQDKLFRLSYYE